MDKTVFLYQWFSFDLQYYLILSNTNNVLHSSIKSLAITQKITARKLAFCKSTSHIPHPKHPTSQTSRIPNITHLEHPTSQTSHISNIPHPKHPIYRTSNIPNIPHPQHPASPTMSKCVLRLRMHVFFAQ